MDHEAPPTLKSLPVDLEEISFYATQGENDIDPSYDQRGFLDTQTGAVHIVSAGALSCAEGDLAPEELDKWLAEDLPVAEMIVGDSESRYEPIDRWDSSEAYELMEEFAEGTTSDDARRLLQFALRGPKPFRRFKDALAEFAGLRETWFLFKEHAEREAAREWLRTLGIEAEDASPRKLPPAPSKW
jgi:hypothetical protein